MKPLIYRLLTAAQCVVLFCASPHLLADSFSEADATVGTAYPVEQRLSFGDGKNSYSALSYTSPSAAGDSPSALAVGGVNYSFTQRAGSSFLHFNTTSNDNGTHKLAGGTLGNLRLSFLHGDGDGLNRYRRGISGIESNFFHGSASRPYRYTGAGLAWSWTDDLVSHAGTVTIDAPGVDDRSVHFAGATLGGVSATFYQVERDITAGRGLALGWQGRSFSFGFEAIETEQRASWREITAAYHDKQGGTLRFSLSSGRNDRYANGEDSRVGLTYSFTFGGGPRASGTSTTSSFGQNFTAGREAARFDDLTRVGLGAVGIGLVTSSGNPVMDQAARFPTQPNAAFAIMSVVNPISVSRNREHGGSIYRNPDGTFSPSQHVVEGTVNSVGFNPHALVPEGTRATAAWHTHGAGLPGYINEFFSPGDITFNHFWGIDGYLGTPMGRMFEYVLAEQTVYQYVGPGDNEFILPH
ncbi:DUF4329 domain-containing protein [Gammaproteobacteria bacterium]|nr:DUF4329 domain-containing protein [Gammaproteobacteria bacterium]